jgi:hypothetical protein
MTNTPDETCGVGRLAGLVQTVTLLLLHSRYRALSLKLSDTTVYEPQIQARLGRAGADGDV